MILIAAGRGSRLEHFTDERPKCMVKIQGRSILDIQRHALAAHGIDTFHVIRGYLSPMIQLPGATYYENPGWQENNILHSLFCAEDAMEGTFLTSYSDIVYAPQVVGALLASRADIALVVDTQWHTAYQGRTDHPVEQAELVETDAATGHIVKVGKFVGPEHALGEFIGLAKFTEAGGQKLKVAWHKARAAHTDDAPFGHATHFRKAYLTDLFMAMIAQGACIEAVEIQGQWQEIDTVQDLQRAAGLW